MAHPEVQLAAYVDGELDAAEAREIERQLAADPAARETVRIFRETDDLLREAFGPAFNAVSGPVPAALQPSLMRRSRGALRVFAALAATLLVGVIAFAAGYKTAGGPASPTDEVLDDVAGYHAVYARETDHLVEVPASRSAELTAWLGERIGRKLDVPDLSAFGLTFAGGRMLVSDSKPVAQLIYTRPGTMPLGVCVTRTEKPESPIAVDRRNGVDVAWWVKDHYTYIIAGSAPADELKRLGAAVASGT